MVEKSTKSTHWFFSLLNIICLRTHLENIIIPFAHILIVNLRAIPKALVWISRNRWTLFFTLNQLFIFHSEIGSFLRSGDMFLSWLPYGMGHIPASSTKAPRTVLWTKWHVFISHFHSHWHNNEWNHSILCKSI